MVGKSQIKLIKSLQQKKYRIRHGLFVVEGVKIVGDLLNSDFEVHQIYATEADLLRNSEAKIELITETELKKMSGLTNPNKVLGTFRIPSPKEIDFKHWSIALDDVRDPGNLGTIIRLCDWFGIEHLICSKNTVDCFNPKTLQATMGSISRVNIVYTDLPKFLEKTDVPIYGAFMDGESAYKIVKPPSGILVMGNEANGISQGVAHHVTYKIGIPQFGNQTAESLNVASATAILLNEIKRED